MKTCYDASTPPPVEPNTDIVGFYIGGDTPHVWSVQELNASHRRYRLPIFTRNFSADPIADSQAAIKQLSVVGAPPGIALAWDAETFVDPIYFQRIRQLLLGYYVMIYGSLSYVVKNPGPWWIADWDNINGLDADDPAGSIGVQYVSLPGYDLSTFIDTIPFWDTQTVPPPPPPPPPPPLGVTVNVPVLQLTNPYTRGPVVRSVQLLLTGIAADGIFGPQTKNAVINFQSLHRLVQDGIVGQHTWGSLCGVPQ